MKITVSGHEVDFNESGGGFIDIPHKQKARGKKGKVFDNKGGQYGTKGTASRRISRPGNS